MREMYRPPVQFQGEKHEGTSVLPYRKIPGFGQGNDREIHAA